MENKTEKKTIERRQPRSFETQSGIPVKSIYRPENLKLDYDRDLGNAGQYPFTRGIYEGMYRNKLWVMENPVAWVDPKASGERWRDEVEYGLSSVYLGNDDPCKIGLDPDHPLAKNDVGASAIPVYALHIADEFIGHAPLEETGGVVYEIHESESTWGDACWFATVMALADKRGVDKAKIRGTVLNDPILNHGCDFIAVSYWPFEIAFKLHCDLVDYILKHLPKWKAFVPCGNDYHEAGVDAVQQVAFVVGSTVTYVEHALKRGWKLDDIADSFVFSFAASFDFFETVAKLRAARRIWAKIAKNRFGAEDPRLCKARVACRIGASTLPAQNPLANITRISFQALAGVLGGANSIDYCAFDEGLTIPARGASMLNLSINNIIAHETRVPITCDPLGGSYYVEWLTNEIEEKATRLLEELDSMGGMLGVLEKGWLTEQVKKAGIERAEKIDQGKWTITDLNDVVIPKKEQIEVSGFDYGGNLAETRNRIIEECKKFKAERNLTVVRDSLLDLRKKAEKRENLIYPMTEAFKVGATRSEVLGMIREAYGCSYDPLGMIDRPTFLG